MQIIVLHPKGKVSPVQESQMTSVLDDNVKNVSVQGCFDDCQAVVKQIFSDKLFCTDHSIAAVNSINWARILAQITYYFSAYFQLKSMLGDKFDSKKIAFSVPTGNFGDVLAGYYAKRMGLPIRGGLIVATNANDILHTFFQTGIYAKKTDAATNELLAAVETCSPAMDIVISSNFERLLYYLSSDAQAQQNESASDSELHKFATGAVSKWMSQFKSTGGISLDQVHLAIARQDFSSVSVSDDEVGLN